MVGTTYCILNDILIVHSAVPRQLVKNPSFAFLKGLGWGGMATSLSTYLTPCVPRDLRGLRGDVNLPMNLLTPCVPRDLRGLGGDVNLPVNLLTPCVPRDLRGLGEMLTSLSN